MKSLPILLLVFLAAVPVKLAAQNQAIEINDSLSQQIFPLSALEYYQDYSDTLDFEDVSSPAFQDKFRLNTSYTAKDYDDRAVYWVKVVIKHNSASRKKWLLEFYDQRIDEIQAYIPDRTGKYRQYKAGDILAFSERQFQHKNFEFVLDNSSTRELTYFFRIKSEGAADIRIVLRSLNRFIFYALNEYLLFGIFYGMLLIISLYNFLMYTAFREKKYLIYIFYLISIAIYAMCIDGLAFQYLWPRVPSLNKIAYGIAQYSIIVWALAFTHNFLNVRHRLPKVSKVIYATIVARSGYFLYCLLVDSQFFAYGIIEVVPLLLMLGTSILSFHRGYRPARFVIVAYAILLFGFLLKVLTNLGILPFSIVLHYSLRFSLMLEILLLSFALADQVRILKDKRDRARKRIIKQMSLNVSLKEEINKELAEKMALKEKVNRELEQKVRERTLELQENNKKLEESNQKLVAQAKEINQINSMLDLDNWKLKNNIKKELNDRLVNKKMEIAEFNKLFPNKNACYEHLEKLKEEKGFECFKCGNEKYSAGIKLYSRRCTKCGHNESVTAQTVFHGLKFSIEKAFYIAYIATNDHSQLTLDGLSEMLQLRRNTVWSFRSKIQHAVSELRKENKKNSISLHWEQVVLFYEGVADKRGNTHKPSAA